MAEAESTGEAGHADDDGVPARSFLRAFLALFASCTAALCAGSVLLDPTGVFGLRLAPPARQTVRDDDSALLARMAEQPQLLILGSSRVWSIRPARASELTGMSSFNFGVDNALPSDFEAIYHYVRARPRANLKRILFGLDVEALDAHHVGYLDYARLLRPYAPEGSVKPYWVMMPDLLFGADVIDSDVRSFRNLWNRRFTTGNKQAPLPMFTVHQDGGVTWPKNDEARKNGTFDLDKQLTSGFTSFHAIYASFHELGDKRVEELRALLEEIKRDGVTVDVYVPPFHPRAGRELPNIEARNREERKLLAGLAAEGLIRWFPRTRLPEFGGAEDGYYDFQHMTNDNGDKLLENIYGKGAAAGPTGTW